MSETEKPKIPDKAYLRIGSLLNAKDHNGKDVGIFDSAIKTQVRKEFKDALGVQQASDDDLQDVIDKMRVAKARKDNAPPAGDEVLIETFSHIAPQELRWLVPGMLPLGKVVLVAGDPGLFKSGITLDLAAAVSTVARAPWLECLHGESLLLSAEDDPADTILQRLVAAGADLSMVHIIKAIRTSNDKGESAIRYFSLAEDVQSISKALETRPAVRLVVIDPISAYLGKTDTHVNAAVREVLHPLSVLAAERNVTVLIVSHLNKGSNAGTAAIYRVSGSLAFVAAARAVFAVTKDKEDKDRRLLLPVKHNLAPTAKGWAYRVRTAPNGAPVAEWELNPVDVEDVDAAVEHTGRSSGKAARDREVEGWLRERLAAGSQPASKLREEGKAKGFSKNRVNEVKADLGVVVEAFEGRPEGRWFWSLPGTRSPNPHTTPLESVSPLGSLGSTQGAQPTQPPQEAAQDSLSTSSGKAGDVGVCGTYEDADGEPF